jgi:hypothetical protein
MNEVNNKLGKLKQVTEIIGAVGISGLLGGNLASFLLVYHPKEAIPYRQYSFFEWRMISK